MSLRQLDLYYNGGETDRREKRWTKWIRTERRRCTFTGRGTVEGGWREVKERTLWKERGEGNEYNAEVMKGHEFYRRKEKRLYRRRDRGVEENQDV